MLNGDCKRLEVVPSQEAKKIFAEIMSRRKLANPHLRADLPGGSSAGQNGGEEGLTAALTFTAGAILTWRGVTPLAQLGFAGLGGMAASAAGLWP